jgi:hypothetical protein
MTDVESDAEHRLAVLTSWGLFGAFGIGVVLTGFKVDEILITATGYAMIVAGFISHLIINRIYRMHFRAGEIAAAITLFGVSSLAFMAHWGFTADFSETDMWGGLLGLVVVLLTFLIYLATRFGLKGAFSMFHIPHS